jgi:hypothetical protein
MNSFVSRGLLPGPNAAAVVCYGVPVHGRWCASFNPSVSLCGRPCLGGTGAPQENGLDVIAIEVGLGDSSQGLG